MKIETIEELDEHLDHLGWSRAQLCRNLGLHRNTPTRWPPVPQYVIAYLELALVVKDAITRINVHLDALRRG